MDESTNFAAPTGIEWQGDVGVVQYGGGDKNMICMFYNKAVHSPAKSTEAGRPVFQDQVYVRIHPPGERLNIVDRPANGSDAQRWPSQWHAFLQKKQQHPEGTPIDLLYPEHPAIPAMLRASSVHTVEQLANLSGPAIDAIGMGAQSYVNAAAKYLEMANKGVKAGQLRHELEERDRQIRVQAQQIAELNATVAQLKEQRGMAPSLETLQAMIAGAMQRPEHMPNRSFDAQTAMIAANHPTKVVSDAAANKPRRSRPRLTG